MFPKAPIKVQGFGMATLVSPLVFSPILLSNLGAFLAIHAMHISHGYTLCRVVAHVNFILHSPPKALVLIFMQ
jgi:hypothetical protein